MITDFATSRRTFLAAVAGLLAFATRPGDRLSSGMSEDPVDGLLRRIRSTPGAIAIAGSWLARAAPPVDHTALRASLIRDIDRSGERLQQAIADDFARGRILLQDGWPVAETEARLCALALLATA